MEKMLKKKLKKKKGADRWQVGALIVSLLVELAW